MSRHRHDERGAVGRQKHPLRRWWVYCFVAWALWTTTVGHAILGLTLLVLGQPWLRELVLLAVAATIVFPVARALWRTSSNAVVAVGDIAYTARWRIRHRRQRRVFASTRNQIRRLPQTAGQRSHPDARGPRTNHR